MFLKQLIIQNGTSTIRDITFQKGVNFIVDETPKNSTSQTTGNNVGKTTVLRLIGYCFGRDGKNIYKDTEFKKQPNTKIENFLKENNITITVVLCKDLNDDSSEQIVIKRNFLTYKKKIQEINGERITNNKKFGAKLKELIFNSITLNPTFRQIVSKNIRDEANRMKNIVKTLDSFAGGEVYEALYLFWLGLEFDNLERKAELLEEIKVEKRLQKRLLKDSNLSLIEQTLKFVNTKIEQLNKQKDTFKLNENYSLELEKLSGVKVLLNKLSTQLSVLEIRKDLIIESKEDLEKEYSNVNVSQIESLYKKAQIFIPNIQVSFKDTIHFHNKMIKEKLNFITKELPILQDEIVSTNEQITLSLKEEQELVLKLKKSGITKDLEKIVAELNQQFEKKGELEEQKRQWKSSNKNLDDYEEELSKINKSINSKDELIQDRIAKFNTFFSEMSNKFYGEYYILSSQKNDKGYELVVTNLEGNPSTGKKKGQIAAFDFAYIEFSDAIGINCLRFIMHDQLENIHDNQLNTLIGIASNINAQYIVPILRDKIPQGVDISKYEILSLSQKDMLFKLS
jgi:uncharacterized protein YydD (DUF2326 family)